MWFKSYNKNLMYRMLQAKSQPPLKQRGLDAPRPTYSKCELKEKGGPNTRPATYLKIKQKVHRRKKIAQNKIQISRKCSPIGGGKGGGGLERDRWSQPKPDYKMGNSVRDWRPSAKWI